MRPAQAAPARMTMLPKMLSRDSTLKLRWKIWAIRSSGRQTLVSALHVPHALNSVGRQQFPDQFIPGSHVPPKPSEGQPLGAVVSVGRPAAGWVERSIL